MKIDIMKIWNKHFGIEEESHVDTTPIGLGKIDGFDDIKKVVRAAIFDGKRHGILFTTFTFLTSLIPLYSVI